MSRKYFYDIIKLNSILYLDWKKKNSMMAQNRTMKISKKGRKKVSKTIPIIARVQVPKKMVMVMVMVMAMKNPNRALHPMTVYLINLFYNKGHFYSTSYQSPFLLHKMLFVLLKI